MKMSFIAKEQKSDEDTISLILILGSNISFCLLK